MADSHHIDSELLRANQASRYHRLIITDTARRRLYQQDGLS